MRGWPIFTIATVLIGLKVSADAPRAPDVMITTRTTYDAPQSSVITEVLYRQGDRRRRETSVALPGTTAGRTITIVVERCDLHQHVAVFPEHRTFIAEPIVTAPSQPPPAPRAADPRTGPVVTVTIETRDTGERRQVGSLVARHVRTTRTTTPSPGASTPANVETTDGWYVDVEDPCHPNGGATLGFLSAQQAGQPINQIRLIQIGPVERGVPIELTKRDDSMPLVTTVTLVELSERPLDRQLFEIPAGYRPAVPVPFGGFDPSRPDSIGTRMQVYAEWMADAVVGAVRSLRPR